MVSAYKIINTLISADGHSLSVTGLRDAEASNSVRSAPNGSRANFYVMIESVSRNISVPKTGDADGEQRLFSAGHNVHYEPQGTRRIFTAPRSDHCAYFVILVTLHYKLMGNQVLGLPNLISYRDNLKCTLPKSVKLM